MRLSNVRPLSGTDSTLMCHTHKLRMTVFRTTKGGLLCAKRQRIEPQYVTFCNLNRKRPNINKLRFTQEKRGKRVAPMAQTGRRTAATRPHEGFIRKLGVKVFTERGRRRRPTLLNRMWSEAQLAVSNAYKHRPRRGRTACWVVGITVMQSYGMPQNLVPVQQKNLITVNAIRPLQGRLIVSRHTASSAPVGRSTCD